MPFLEIRQDPSLKPMLQDLAEEFCFSDPDSGTATEKLDILLNEPQRKGDPALVKEIERVLAERNRLCKTSKL